MKREVTYSGPLRAGLREVPGEYVSLVTRTVYTDDLDYSLEIGPYSLGISDALLLKAIVDQFVAVAWNVE